MTIIQAAILCKTAFAPIAPSFGRLLRREINQSKPDIIHVHLPNPAVLFTSAIPKDVPVIVHWHADVQGAPNRFLSLAYPFYKFFEQGLLSRAASIICSSAPYLEASQSLFKWREKCRVIPLGINPERYPIKHSAPHKPPMILSVGRFSYYKGYEHLVKAAEQTPGATYVIAGGGPARKGIQQLVHDLGLTDRVFLPGDVPDNELTELFENCTLFCLPSVDRGEAFGVVLLEAMLYGKPLISTSIPGSGTSWVNKHEVTGIVVPPKSPSALANAINHLLNNPERIQEYGRAAQQRFSDRFIISSTAKSIETLYRHTIAANSQVTG